MCTKVIDIDKNIFSYLTIQSHSKLLIVNKYFYKMITSLQYFKDFSDVFSFSSTGYNVSLIEAAVYFYGCHDFMLLLLNDKRYSPQNYTIEKAAAYGYLHIVKQLHRLGLKLEFKNLTLKSAINNNHYNVVDYIFRHTKLTKSNFLIFTLRHCCDDAFIHFYSKYNFDNNVRIRVLNAARKTKRHAITKFLERL